MQIIYVHSRHIGPHWNPEAQDPEILLREARQGSAGPRGGGEVAVNTTNKTIQIGHKAPKP